MNVFIIIPAYNEEKTIEKVLNEVVSFYRNVIVIDDGSTDNTLKILEHIPDIVVCKHIVNRGQGAALATGTRKALRMGADVIVHFDADGQMQAEDIKKVTDPVINDNYDVAIGSRFMDIKSNIPKVRKLLLYFAKHFNKIFLGIPDDIKDTTSGFRALSRKAALEIEITQDRMAHCSEILKEIFRKKLKAAEVPVKIEYTKYSLQKGQKASNAFQIVWSLFISKFQK